MTRRVPRALASGALGAIILYVGWGEALTFVLPQTEACLLQGPPPGLHLNHAGMIEYAECQYTYRYAWPVLFFVSLVGVLLVVNAVRLARSTPNRTASS